MVARHGVPATGSSRSSTPMAGAWRVRGRTKRIWAERPRLLVRALIAPWTRRGRRHERSRGRTDLYAVQPDRAERLAGRRSAFLRRWSTPPCTGRWRCMAAVSCSRSRSARWRRCGSRAASTVRSPICGPPPRRWAAVSPPPRRHLHSGDPRRGGRAGGRRRASARARGGARGAPAQGAHARADGRGGRPREGRVPGGAVARAAHAAERRATAGRACCRRGRSATSATIARALDVIERNANAQVQLDRRPARRLAHHHRQAAARRPAGRCSPASSRPRWTPSGRPPRPRAFACRRVLDPRAGPVTGDPDRLQQVVWNLLIERGEVHAEGRPGPASVCSASTRTSRSWSATPDRASRPTSCRTSSSASARPTARAPRAHAGLGLGLAIVKHLVELHGGTRRRARAPATGQGATFIVTLPLDDRRDACRRRLRASIRRAPSIEPLPAGARLDGLRVLVVDDDPDALELADGDSRGAPARVVQRALSAAEALNAAARRGGPTCSSRTSRCRARTATRSSARCARSTIGGRPDARRRADRLRPDAGPDPLARRGLQHARPEARRPGRIDGDHRERRRPAPARDSALARHRPVTLAVYTRRRAHAAPPHRSRAGSSRVGHRRPGRAADGRGRGLVAAVGRPTRHPGRLDGAQLGRPEVRLRGGRRRRGSGSASSQPGRQLDDQQGDQDRRQKASHADVALEDGDPARGRRLPAQGGRRRGGPGLRGLFALPGGRSLTGHRVRLGRDGARRHDREEREQRSGDLRRRPFRHGRARPLADREAATSTTTTRGSTARRPAKRSGRSRWPSTPTTPGRAPRPTSAPSCSGGPETARRRRSSPSGATRASRPAQAGRRKRGE